MVGEIVLYTLRAADCDQINGRRTSALAISNMRANNPPNWPEGAQAHVGSRVSAGDVLPMVVTTSRAEKNAADKLDHVILSGQVILNGSDTLWVTERPDGFEPGTWREIED